MSFEPIGFNMSYVPAYSMPNLGVAQAGVSVFPNFNSVFSQTNMSLYPVPQQNNGFLSLLPWMRTQPNMAFYPAQQQNNPFGNMFPWLQQKQLNMPFQNFNASNWFNSSSKTNSTNFGITAKASQKQSSPESSNSKTSNAEKVSLDEAVNAGLKFQAQKHKDRWKLMDPIMQKNLIKLADYAKSNGITITIISNVRDEAEQQELIRKGRPAAKKGSRHLTGRAVDIAVNGNKNKNLAILGKYWRDTLGYRWGADFKHPKSEPWHFDIG